MSISSELGLRIRYYRKREQMSQEKLAEICNLHPTYIGQLERGEKNATIESIYKISHGLNIPLSKLMENLEDFETSESVSSNIPLEIYHQLLSMPYDKQQKIQIILQEIISFSQEPTFQKIN